MYTLTPLLLLTLSSLSLADSLYPVDPEKRCAADNAAPASDKSSFAYCKGQSSTLKPKGSPHLTVEPTDCPPTIGVCTKSTGCDSLVTGVHFPRGKLIYDCWAVVDVASDADLNIKCKTKFWRGCVVQDGKVQVKPPEATTLVTTTPTPGATTLATPKATSIAKRAVADSIPLTFPKPHQACTPWSDQKGLHSFLYCKGQHSTLKPKNNLTVEPQGCKRGEKCTKSEGCPHPDTGLLFPKDRIMYDCIDNIAFVPSDDVLWNKCRDTFSPKGCTVENGQLFAREIKPNEKRAPPADLTLPISTELTCKVEDDARGADSFTYCKGQHSTYNYQHPKNLPVEPKGCTRGIICRSPAGCPSKSTGLVIPSGKYIYECTDIAEIAKIPTDAELKAKCTKPWAQFCEIRDGHIHAMKQFAKRMIIDPSTDPAEIAKTCKTTDTAVGNGSFKYCKGQHSTLIRGLVLPKTCSTSQGTCLLEKGCDHAQTGIHFDNGMTIYDCEEIARAPKDDVLKANCNGKVPLVCQIWEGHVTPKAHIAGVPIGKRMLAPQPPLLTPSPLAAL